VGGREGESESESDDEISAPILICMYVVHVWTYACVCARVHIYTQSLNPIA
jgi:hypothetical protein